MLHIDTPITIPILIDTILPISINFVVNCNHSTWSLLPADASVGNFWPLHKTPNCAAPHDLT